MNPTIGTVEMHAGGEPVRIVVSGFPEIPGATILAKRRHAIEHLDHLRRLLMFEPRGHTDMYGVIPVTPDHPEADLAVLFMHNEGYSTMCGHATIAVARWAIERGLVSPREPLTEFALQVPAGLVRVSASVTSGRVGRVAFRSVPAFVAHRSTPVAIPGYGEITLDVAYGGAFYAVADAAAFGLRVPGSPIADLVNAAWATTGAVSGRLPLNHPDDADLGFLYGTILTDGADIWSERPTANVCVFADRQVVHRRMRIDLPHPLSGTVPQVINPIKFSATPLEYRHAPPLLGQHTARVLAERLGYDEARIAELAAQRIIVVNKQS